METTVIIILSLVIVSLLINRRYSTKLIKTQREFIKTLKEGIKTRDEYILQLEKTKKAKPGFLDQIFGLLTVGAIFQKEDEPIEEQFKKALENEDYKLAAKLRDQINKGKDEQSN